MTAPVTTAPSAVRAAAPSGADGDPASGATFASALDGALHPDRAPASGAAKGRGDVARGRSGADHGTPVHARSAGRPSSPARDQDGTPALKSRSRRDERTPADDAASDPGATAPPGAPGTVPVPADALVAAALPLAVPAPGTPPAGPVPGGSASTDTGPAAVGPAGAPAAALPGVVAGQPADAGLSAAAGTTAVQASPQPVDPAALQVLAAAAGRPSSTPAGGATAPTATVAAGPAADIAVPPAASAPTPASAATDPAGSAPLPGQVPLPPTADAATHAVRLSTQASAGPTAPADAEPPAGGAAPALGTAVAGPVGASGSGGPSSADPGDSDRHDPAAAATPAATQVVGAAPAAPAAPVLAPAAAAAAAPAAPPPVATQLVQHVAVLTNGPDGTHSVTVVLHPDSLGPVQVQVTLNQGTIDLTMRGAHEHGRAALLDSLPDLRRDLESAGLTCSTLDVDQGTGGSWSTQHQSAQQQAAHQWGGEGRGQSPTRGENRQPPWLRPVVPTGGPVAGSSRSTSAGVDVRV
jgi:flagellar hook-length control protein FliK